MKNYEFTQWKNSRIRCLFLFIILSGVYLLDNIPFFHISRRTYFIYIIKPIICIGVTLIIWFFPRVKAKAKLRFYGSLKGWVGYIAFIYVLFLFFGGFIEGFGKSPYDVSILGIIKNIIILGSALVAKELIRAYLVNSLGDKHLFLTMTIIALLMTFFSLPFERIYTLNTDFKSIQYIGETILTELSKNILVTYLVYIGGAKLSIIYLGILQGVFWVSPILPNLTWITKALIGIMCPILSLMFIQYVYLRQSKELKNSHEKNENPLGWIVTSIASIGIVWFALGVFPVKPSVIATGSMKPMIKPGDMVLIKKIKGNEVKVGDVIQFKKDNIYIFHRIIDTKQEKSQIKYITKGDNNSVEDKDPVALEEVKGKVIYVVPKIGWPTLLLKSKNNVPKERVEF